MAIYIVPPNVEIEEKTPESSELIQVSKEKTYTQEEVLAMLEQIQKGK